jgi:hypothetical protein
MNTHLYYNASSGPKDNRLGHGYGVNSTGRHPVLGKTAGNMTVYPSGGRYDKTPDDEDKLKKDTDDFVEDLVTKTKIKNKIDHGYIGSDQGAQSSVDARTLTKNQQALEEQMQFTAKARPGISPFSHNTIYKPGGFDGGPIGTGDADQAFNTTGPARKTGTQYGSSRAPLDYHNVEPISFHYFSLQDYFDSDMSDPSIWPMIKHNNNVRKLLNGIERE